MSYTTSEVFKMMSNEKPNKHMYFNDDGDEISHERWEQEQERWEQEQEQEQDVRQQQAPRWAIKTPHINFSFTITHPFLLLQFLRFVDYYNENALPDEVYMLKPMSYTQYKNLMDNEFMKNTPTEFEEEAYELRDRIGNHLDFSDLASI
jgi:hypothetical protein